MITLVYLKKNFWDDVEELYSTKEYSEGNYPLPGSVISYGLKEYYIENTLLQRNRDSAHLEIYVSEYQHESTKEVR